MIMRFVRNQKEKKEEEKKKKKKNDNSRGSSQPRVSNSFRRRTAQMDLKSIREIMHLFEKQNETKVEGIVSKRIPFSYLRRESMLPLENLKELNAFQKVARREICAHKVLEKPALQRFDSADYYLAKQKNSLNGHLIFDRLPSPTKEACIR
eukprot:g2888.t1